ncbi:uncharacterized protein LOC121247510 isoform X3 [Juglans microcarpa x Juglans regia]|uniref:uncharacterized protein LOC121247510 isoform X3 n=1 Tax=Juglans microcarpa x Juglans regia TaxID=2249226 RepID=UPI001B7F5141|nr:uncharacterized protein LOC121247510 isoform X3 [Juglans microcarpa x Juglans regia]
MALALPLPPLKLLSSALAAASSSQESSSSSSLSSFSYRPAVILPGLGNNSSDYKKLEATLNEQYGVPTLVAKVSRLDWLRNAAGLVDPNYWRGTLRPRPVLDWYLKRVDEAVLEAKELAQDASHWFRCQLMVGNGSSSLTGGTLSLIGHSAGGWLARVYMEEFGLSDISLLLTLGTPHLYIQGAPFFGSSIANVESVIPNDNAEVAVVNDVDTSASNATTLRARLVGQGYKQVCGQADIWGDGVVPEVSAHLEGAYNITLDGVYHSPVGSDDASRPWYGSPVIVEKWIHYLLN